MFCKHCGKEINDQAVVCPNCGCATDNGNAGANKAVSEDASSVGYAILGFFFPIVGLILYLVWKDSFPLRAKSAGKGALISVICYAVFLVIYLFFLFLILGIGMSNCYYYY